MLTHFSLFSGIGGIDLAAEWAGFETIGQCEFADYPTKVLEKHWPDVPRWKDVRDITKSDFNRRTGLDEVTLISGGFPCQDLSGAGRQAGLVDAEGNITRSGLWYEMLRIIRSQKLIGVQKLSIGTSATITQNRCYVPLNFKAQCLK